jgi:hypothetical protein
MARRSKSSSPSSRKKTPHRETGAAFFFSDFVNARDAH